MPKNLKRYYGRGDFHFITFSCHKRVALLGTVSARNLFLSVLSETRAQYQFALLGYVIMPEHVHLLIGEPRVGDPSKVIQGLKLRVSKRVRKAAVSTGSFRFHGAFVTHFWQPRSYDFNVWSAKKRKEKLDYMHRNPVSRKLVEDPKDWVWSSYASYSNRGTPLIQIDFVD